MDGRGGFGGGWRGAGVVQWASHPITIFPGEHFAGCPSLGATVEANPRTQLLCGGKAECCVSAWGARSYPQEPSWSHSSELSIAACALLPQQVVFSKVRGGIWMNVSCPAYTAGSLQSLTFVSPGKETLGVCWRAPIS